MSAALEQLVERLAALELRTKPAPPRKWYARAALCSDTSREPTEGEIILPCVGCGSPCLCNSAIIESGPKEDNQFNVWAGVACRDKCFPLLANGQIVPSPTVRVAETFDTVERMNMMIHDRPNPMEGPPHERTTDCRTVRGPGAGKTRGGS
jgi:hypothetical protein